jgi:hypothetical protein
LRGYARRYGAWFRIGPEDRRLLSLDIAVVEMMRSRILARGSGADIWEAPESLRRLQEEDGGGIR